MTLDVTCGRTITQSDVAQCSATFDELRRAAAQGDHQVFLSGIISGGEIDLLTTTLEQLQIHLDLFLRKLGVQRGPGYGDGNRPTDLYFAYRGVHWILEITFQGSALDALETAMNRKYCQEVRAHERKYLVVGMALNRIENEKWTIDYAVHSSPPRPTVTQGFLRMDQFEGWKPWSDEETQSATD